MPSSTTSDFAIRLCGVGKRYKLYRRPADKVIDAFGISRWLFWRQETPIFWALRDFNLEIRKGERLGIIGRNGAGKSTLLRIIAGAAAATEGTVAVNGRIQALMELGTGFHPEFTGRQNIRASLAYQGMSPGKIRGKEDEIIDFAELAEFIDQPVKTYSAGMYARLAFSTATAIEPDILIIDEVLGAGDAYFAGKCVERMKRLTEDSGATVLFVSHDLGSVQQLCERAIWIDRGHAIMDAPPLEVTKAYYASILQQEEARLKAHTERLAQRAKAQAPPPRSEGPAAPTRPAAPEPPSGVQDRWHTDHAAFARVEPIDQHGQVQYVFRHGQSFGFRIDLNVYQPIPVCWLVLVIYDARGNVTVLHTQHIADPLETGMIRWELLTPGPNLRQGEYVVSIELVPMYDAAATDKLPFFCHWNRCVSFKVDELYTGHIPLGTVALPFQLRSVTPPAADELPAPAEAAAAGV